MATKKAKQPKSLGEFLIEKKLVSWDHLESALERKLTAGGHLATSLIELGHLDEAAAGKALAGASCAPSPPSGALDEIEPDACGAIPPELAAQHGAVPFEIKRKVLQVAMVDPTDATAVQEITEASGGKIKTWIAPEPRIHQAIEKFYDLPMSPRLAVACRILDGEDVEPSVVHVSGPSPAAVGNTGSTEPASGHVNPGPDMPGMPGQSSMDAEMAAAAGSYNETGLFTPSLPGVTVVAEPDFSPEELLGERLCGAESVQDLAEAALDYAHDSFPRCALFAVKSDIAKVWSTRGLDLDADGTKSFETALNVNPVFQLLTVHDHYRGPLPAEKEYRKFYSSLELAFPSETLLAPGYLDDKIRVIFYGDSGENGKIQGETATYLELAGKLALALKVIALKTRIRT